jgi:hypothetical protein
MIQSLKSASVKAKKYSKKIYKIYATSTMSAKNVIAVFTMSVS